MTQVVRLMRTAPGFRKIDYSLLYEWLQHFLQVNIQETHLQSQLDGHAMQHLGQANAISEKEGGGGWGVLGLALRLKVTFEKRLQDT